MSFAWLPQLWAATWAANGVPLREPLKPIRPADDQVSTLPSGSEIATMVLLNDAWTCATPCGTTRFSFFLAPFFSFPPVAGVAAAASLAISSLLLLGQLLLAGDGRLTGTLARTGVGVGALAAHRQALAMTDAAVTADLHQ